MADSSRYTAFETLTRKHGLVCMPSSGIDAEAVILAVGEIIGLENVKAASRMNKHVVIFVSIVNMVAQVVEHGLFFLPTCWSRYVLSTRRQFGFPSVIFLHSLRTQNWLTNSTNLVLLFLQLLGFLYEGKISV